MPDVLTEKKTLPSACPLDCPDACCLDVTVEDGRVTQIEGARRHPLTAGFLCSKVGRYHRHVYAPERLRYPMVRDGERGSGAFRRVSWDEAFERVAGRLREVRDEHGGEAILPFCYGGSNGALTQDAVDARLFRRLGASRLLRTVCAATSGRAARGLYGRMPGVEPRDFIAARLVVVWGQNPSVSSIHLVPLILEAKQRGAKLVVVDPRETPLAKKADLHLQVRPGTDLPLALAVHRELFETGGADLDFLADHATGHEELRRRAAPWTVERAAEVSGIDAADIRAFTRLYTETSPAVIRCGWGPERNRNGGSAIAAILGLPAVAGKFGVRGGGFMLSNSSAWGLDTDRLASEAEPPTRAINMNRLGAALLGEADPEVRFLFVYNANPLATLPDQEAVRRGLSREDLYTVVFDQVMTDTARYADVLLPATTFLEHHELSVGYGAMVLQEAPPVIPPVGEARPNAEVFAELLRRLDLARDGDLVDPAEMARTVLESGDGSLRRRVADGEVAQPFEEAPPVQMVDVFPATDDGKIHLVSEALDREAPEGLYTFRSVENDPSFPLALISPATHRTISSSLGELYKESVPIELDPEDAAARGIESGDTVRVWNELGEVRVPASLSRDLRPGLAVLPKGIWSHNTENGATSNALVPPDLNDLAGGACFNDARVEVEKVEVSEGS